jgi:curved DNA-binding protein CbpA
MVTDPYAELGIEPDADDEAIRRRYLELVREFPPDLHPEKFSRVRAAYESLKDMNTRLQHRLFERGRQDSLDALIEELACRTPRHRVSLEKLLQMVQTRS